ncbi:MAG: SpoIIE family protein phosphatase [Phycisphaerales bacterium]
MPESPSHPVHALRLEPLSGPDIEPITLEGRHSLTLGRSTRAGVVLDDPGVSRMHARFSRIAGAWVLADLTSKHGTFINAAALTPGEPTPVAVGDLIRIGPWTFRVRADDADSSSVLTSDDRAQTATRIRSVSDDELGGIAQHRLNLLIDCAASISAASSIEALAEVVLDACRAGAGYARAAMVRPLSAGGDVQVLASRAPSSKPDEPLRLSRSLIEGASQGQVVRLEGDTAAPSDSHSILTLGIHSATCVPIMLGASVEACLYLDARDAERRVSADATAFCLALARLAGLAIANIKRVETERKRALMEGDLRAARVAQRLMLPPAAATLGDIRYAMTTLPGRIVAGDLFDVVPLSDGRVAAFLGDVSGKGAGAAMLMAMVQTHLDLTLRHTDDPAAVLADVNATLAPKLSLGQFISLWLGVFDPRDNTVRYVDAGHGHCLQRRDGETPERIQSPGGLPIGVLETSQYTSEVLELGPGGRVILFSDGAVEQPNPSGELFTLWRVLRSITRSPTPEEDVRRLVEAVKAHAGTDTLADDLTVASVEFLPKK